ncbi:hypothetical protein SK128_022516 [Halocaridina rubra]|uniref:Uncharacterized protein n=1 Tax=Halocaridina rubra TaxID=373956 RepID=A0AAN8ZX20_HALRR
MLALQDQHTFGVFTDPAEMTGATTQGTKLTPHSYSTETIDEETLCEPLREWHTHGQLVGALLYGH